MYANSHCFLYKVEMNSLAFKWLIVLRPALKCTIKRTESLKLRLPRPKTRKKRTCTRPARRLSITSLAQPTQCNKGKASSNFKRLFDIIVGTSNLHFVFKAVDFHRLWKTPPTKSEERKKYAQIKRGDGDRGLERIGRQGSGTFSTVHI